MAVHVSRVYRKRLSYMEPVHPTDHLEPFWRWFSRPQAQT
jgi:hypothetical protein